MEITSFRFLVFFAALLLLYYSVPKKLQWVTLLAASLLFFLLGDSPAAIWWPVSAVLATWLCTGCMARAAAQGREKLRKGALAVNILLLVGALVLLKYRRLGGGLAIPLGISYYTFILTGYAVDVYNGIAAPQKNPLKLALFGMFFPLMTSGPITIWREHAAPLFETHRFCYEQVTRGLQRMVWGFFKKLVIAERAAVLTNAVFDNYGSYSGVWIWLGALMFTLQLYTDFSGCMDIVIGAAESLGVTLPENFTQPFFSRSISEYWRRWHASLGVWMRNYVFYPLLRSSLFTGLGKTLRARCGKKRGKQLTTFAAMFILWTAIGLWHGGNIKYVIGSGLLHWFYIVFGELTLPFWKRVLPALHIPMEGVLADRFRVLRTFFLVNIGNVFFRAASAGDAVRMLGRGWLPAAPGSLSVEELAALGLAPEELLILLLAAAALLLVSVLETRQTADGRTLSVRDRIAGHALPVRWALWMGLLFFVIIFGNYGPGYSSSAFIYAGF